MLSWLALNTKGQYDSESTIATRCLITLWPTDESNLETIIIRMAFHRSTYYFYNYSSDSIVPHGQMIIAQ